MQALALRTSTLTQQLNCWVKMLSHITIISLEPLTAECLKTGSAKWDVPIHGRYPAVLLAFILLTEDMMRKIFVNILFLKKG